ncbi:MAG: thioredoxin-dependent thiol peroxidase [Bdellovibrionia bacterium]
MAKAKSEVKGLQQGDTAPAFTLESDTGEKVSLKDFKGKKVVLYFYPKDMTPGCTQEACDFRDSFARIKKSDAVVLGVSKDSVVSHQKFKAKHDLPFTLLSDSEGKVCELYGVWQEKSLYGKKFMGIVRSTFVIDEKGRILRSFPKVKVNGHVDEILGVLKP